MYTAFRLSALMHPTGSVDGLAVATPERVTFEYQVAGLGSRFLAQLIDFGIQVVMLIVLSLAALGLAQASGDGNAALLIWILAAFLIFFGYFAVWEGIWSGQTPGKRALRLRVIGDRGEPVTITQVGIRNLVRIIDFLPVFYGVGIATVFLEGGGKRLGDFAAGTLVARERERVKLRDLVVAAAAATQPAAAEPAVRRSIWAADQEQSPEDRPVPAARAVTRLDPYQDALRRLDPALRRFVVAYARRRNQLPVHRREALAAQVEPGLQQLLPAEVAAFGPAAVLDGLAALVYAEATAR